MVSFSSLLSAAWPKKLTKEALRQSDPGCAAERRVQRNGKEPARPLVQHIVDELLRRHRQNGSVHPHDIAEVIDSRAVAYDEVEYIITRLESEGMRVGEPLNHHDIGVMRRVLESARRLSSELSRRPTVGEVARDSGYPEHAVKRALENGKSAAFPRR